MEGGTEKGHNPWYILLVVYNILTLVAVFVFNGFSSSSSSGWRGELFLSTQKEQAEKFALDISPASWIFNIWVLIYVWQVAWLLYTFLNLFRKNLFNHPLYLSPYLLPPSLLGFYVVANGCNIAWCFLFDRGYLIASCAASIVMSVLLVTALAVSYLSLHSGYVDLLRQKREFEVWLVRGLVHNGLAVYATWVSVASLINMAMALAYQTGSDVSVAMSSTIALGVLALGMGVLGLVDVCLLDRYSRYTLTPYVVAGVSLLAVLLNNWRPGETNSLFALVLCALAAGLFLLKVVVSVLRHVRERREAEE